MRRSLLSAAACAALSSAFGPLAFGQVADQTAPQQLAQTQTADAASQTTTPSQDLQEIIVTGTRQLGRTAAEAPAPVDVITQSELERTGNQNVLDALNKLLPSIELPAEGFDTAGLVRSARLRGLSPDDTLVLINGKRRDVSANINADVGPVGGSDPVDFDLIPVSLIDHVEVLRDGAAAQYGSDAIAGVINIILKHDTDGGSAYSQEGAYYRQDGFTADEGVNTGVALGEDGYIDFAFNYRNHQHTNRTGYDTRQIPGDPNPGRILGDPAYELATAGYNAAYKIDDTVTLYSFATYGYRGADAFENWRTQTKFPIFYPNGFVPHETLNENDFGITGGIKGIVLGDLSWDVSTTYGEDHDRIGNINSVNIQLYQDFGFSPTRFYNGTFDNAEWTTNVDLAKPVDVGILSSPLNVAVGVEYRRNYYQLKAGDFYSRYSVGSQAYPGFELVDQSNPSRHNIAVYGDLAGNITPEWQFDLAGRYEHYSDVGDNETGKVTTRYDVTPQLGFRATVANGFRAPSLAQEYFSATNVSPTTAVVQLPVQSPAAKSLGATPLKAERSNSYSAGITWEPIEGLHTALDAYRIDIRDRIVDSGLLTGDFVNSAISLNGSSIEPGVVALAQFYTNAIDTQTNGIDITADYTSRFDDGGKINWTVALNLNETHITRASSGPALFAASGSPFFTPDVASEIKEDSPKDRVVFQAVYLKDEFSFTFRETRWGTTVEVVSDPNTGAAPYYRNIIHPQYITDVEFGYNISDNWQISVGANNLFNNYPDKTIYASRFVNSTVYSPSSPFGFDGGFYYGRLNYRF